MNENIDLTKILKDCPKGTEFWSDNYGVVKFLYITSSFVQPICVKRSNGSAVYYTKEGWCNIEFPANCLLWPSKDCRDWSNFKAPWYKKDKFDPKTLQPFDKVLFLDSIDGAWTCGIFSYANFEFLRPFKVGICSYKWCIPYNDDTKHLVGTTEEAPEYYRYWED